MEYKTNLLPKSELEINVILPFSEFEPQVKRAAVLLSEEREIEGFRKGKAPYDVIKSKFGEHGIYEKAAELAVRKTYPGILQELTNKPPDGKAEFLPLGAPSVTVTKLAPGNELEYKAVVALMPDITLPDYKEIAKKTMGEKQEAPATEDDVEKTIEWVRDSLAEYNTVERPAAHGDAVEIDFELRHEGVKIANGDSRNHPVIIGKGKFMPGFEENLIGMSVDEVKDFSVNVPEDWHDTSVAGKELAVKTTLKSVKERKVPEITDEFVKKLGTFESTTAFRKNIQEGLSAEKKEKEKQRIRALAIERIAQGATMDIPDVLVESELDKMFEDMKHSVEQMGMKWEDYIVHIKKNPDTLRTEWRDDAVKRVRVALSLREIAKREAIAPSDEEIQKEANRFLEQYRTVEQAEAAIDPERLREYTRGILRNQKVFEFLESQG